MVGDEQLLERLINLQGSKTIILGIGNTLKGDDGAGAIVCRQLAGKTSAEVIDAATVPENYIQLIIKKAPRNLLIVDAIDFGGQPGTINLFKPEQLGSLVVSTHTLSPRIFIDLIVQEIDVRVYFLGIQPLRTQIGSCLSAAVDKAVRELVSILTEIFRLSE